MSKHYLFQNGKIILADNGKTVPDHLPESMKEYLINSGFVDKEHHEGDLWAELSEQAPLPPDMALFERRTAWLTLGEQNFFRMGKAFHIMDWQRTHRFCGRCGSEMTFDSRESAMSCPSCGEQYFPVICPAVIVAVVKEGHLLMGHGINFPAGRYSVLAGFTEPGESLEGTVMREIYEESRIHVKNISYFGSQPWPFPRSLMVGFTAEWESGEIVPEVSELTDVRWFAPKEIPDYYRGVSISARLIEDFIRKYS